MDKVIGESPHAFVGERQILDITLIANEVIDELVHRKREEVLCKLDIEKTYDHVNWSFGNYTLMRMEFGEKCCRWVEVCITIASFTVIVNRGLSAFLQATRGLR